MHSSLALCLLQRKAYTQQGSNPPGCPLLLKAVTDVVFYIEKSAIAGSEKVASSTHSHRVGSFAVNLYFRNMHLLCVDTSPCQKPTEIQWIDWLGDYVMEQTSLLVSTSGMAITRASWMVATFTRLSNTQLCCSRPLTTFPTNK